ncbi:MAG: cupin domain-containing protein [Candidatus Pacearchaeota archaeon]
MKKETSFGMIEIVSSEPLVEIMTFNKEGKSHTHDGFEYCYVLEGSGKIIGADNEEAKEGDFCRISPNKGHWMIPKTKPFKILIFYGNKNLHGGKNEIQT